MAYGAVGVETGEAAQEGAGHGDGKEEEDGPKLGKGAGGDEGEDEKVDVEPGFVRMKEKGAVDVLGPGDGFREEELELFDEGALTEECVEVATFVKVELWEERGTCYGDAHEGDGPLAEEPGLSDSGGMGVAEDVPCGKEGGCANEEDEAVLKEDGETTGEGDV